MSHALHCYDHVGQPYARARECLVADPRRLFLRAAAAAASRAKVLRAQLQGAAGPRERTTDLELRVSSIEGARPPLDEAALRFVHELRAERAAAAFPVMHMILRIYPLSPLETQLELEGMYAPPLRVVGETVDAALGRRIAEASMLRFIQEVTAHVRDELAPALVRAS